MKTMSKLEVDHMIRSLPNYYRHLVQNEKTFIAKIYGIHTIRIDQFEPIHVMIMQNSLPSIPNSSMSYLFDMKGSSINREVLKKKTNAELKAPTGGKVLKDLDFLRLREMKDFMKLDQEVVDQITSQLAKDIGFLRDERYMDYSLLLGIRKIEGSSQNDNQFKQMDLDLEEGLEDEFQHRASMQAISAELNKKGQIELFMSNDQKWIYQISVIDYLQTFDRSKKNEVLAKKIFKNVDT